MNDDLVNQLKKNIRKFHQELEKKIGLVILSNFYYKGHKLFFSNIKYRSSDSHQKCKYN